MDNSKPKEDSYIFSRSDAESTSTVRLNYQHWLSLRVTGHLLHPSIPTDIPSIRVADVGAGSGVWAIDLSDELPNSRIDALDISDVDFPHPSWVPKNVNFSTLDCFKPFPDDLIEKFDIVNVRFLSPVMRSATIEAQMANVVTLLKPGGYIQWYEPEPYAATSSTGDLSFPTPAVDKLINQLEAPIPGIKNRWIAQLDKKFAEQGLDIVAFDRYPVRDVLLPHFNMTNRLGYEAFCRRFEQEGEIEAAMAVRTQMEEVGREFREGAVVRLIFVLCVGRKAL